MLKHQNVEIDNRDGYYEGLPERLAHELRGNAVATYSKEERAQIQIAKDEERIRKA